MIELYNEFLKKSIEVDRIIGFYQGKKKGPTLIFLGGVHGNEPSGVFALQAVLEELNKSRPVFNGQLYALSGNLHALKKGVRYSKVDLNRIWNQKNIDELREHTARDLNEDIHEQIDLYNTIDTILKTEGGPFYFFDLHTTSGETSPFITVNDNLLNRKFTIQYPLPIVLGIEEFLIGPILSYINELGYVAFGFEGGQHDSQIAIDNHISFIYLSMIFADCISASDANFAKHSRILENHSSITKSFFEIIYHYRIENEEKFQMRPDYMNFQKIHKNEKLALNHNHEIISPIEGRIFMPLYQGKGDDGFFIIKKIPSVFLRLSKILRKTYFDRLFVLLPGISWGSSNKDELVVNLKVARFFTKQFFHLMGYRSKRKDATHLTMKNREVASRNKDYKDEGWFKN
jgi:Succinylglutamate desuccinylase / Aspartoacylase family